MRVRYAVALAALILLGLTVVDLPGGFEPAMQSPASLELPIGTWLEGDDVPRLGASAIALHPTRPIVVAGGNEGSILRSFDEGRSWEWLEGVIPGGQEVLRMKFAPDGELVAVVGGTGAYRSRDFGTTWEWLRGAWDVIYSPGYATDRVMFAISDGELWRSDDGGDTWSDVLPAIDGCPMYVALAPDFADGGPAFATRCDHVLRSSDGGLTWEDVPNRDVDLFADSALARLYALDEGQLIGIGAWNGAYFSEDGGRSWSVVSTGWDFAVLERFHSLAPSADFYRDGLLIATGHYSVYDPEAAVWVIGDGGRWIRQVASAPGMWCRAWGALRGRVIFASTCNGIFRSDDLGGSWEFLHPGVNLEDRRILYTSANDGTRVALYPRAISRYDTRYFLLEDVGFGWQHVATLSGTVFIGRIWVSPDFASDRVLIGLGSDFSGVRHVVSWREGEAELTDHSPPNAPAPIPPAYGEMSGTYEVTFADDFAISRRITLRSGANGATYVSDDAGIGWVRQEPLLPGECNVRPQGDLAALWESRGDVRAGLGCPLGEVERMWLRGQEFERGLILHLAERDGGVHYRRFVVARDNGGEWRLVTTPPETVEAPVPPQGLFAPDDDFLTTWARDFCCASPDDGTVRERIGWAIGPPFEAWAEMMAFEGGFVMRMPDSGSTLALYQSVPVWERQGMANWPLLYGDAVEILDG